MKVFKARHRRKFKRGLGAQYQRFFNKLALAKKNAPKGDKPKGVKTHLRDWVITPQMVHSIVEIHNGQKFIPV